MNTQTYNGWTNYETWNVSLWMDNDQGSQSYWQERSDECFKRAKADSTFTQAERATLDLSDVIRDEYENASQDILENSKAQCSVWADLLGAALSEVNWHEIAEHLINVSAEAYAE